ncbi:MAG: ATP-binding protein [Phycisphaerae bacterium]
MKQQLRQSQRLAALGTAAAMLAHEYNNVMTPIVGYATRALSSDDHEMMAKALRTTLKQAEVVLGMSERILGMAVEEPVAFKPVSVGAVVQDAHECLCRDLAKDGITFTVDIDEGITVWADAKQLQQVFFNLLLNARDALQDRTGRVTIRAKNTDDDTVEIAVTDTGCGISPEECDSVFDPFFTTKPTDSNPWVSGRDRKSGFGLGLALCRDIVHEHRGSISIQSRLNEGTTFTITLPSAR